MNTSVDQQRARIAMAVRFGKRIGYLLFLAACVLFGVGFTRGFTVPVTTAITACMAVGSIILAPAIVFDYGVKKAVREELGIPRKRRM